MFVKKQIGKCHENISIFYKKQPTYNPQMEEGEPYKRGEEEHRKENIMNRTTKKTEINNKGTRYPRSVKKVSFHNGGLLHPTQKPIELLEWIIKTYTNEGEVILDNCFGSCSTGVACINSGRKFIGIEKDEAYFEIGRNRIENTYKEIKKIN